MASSSVIAEARNVEHGSNGLYDLRLVRIDGKALAIDIGLTVFFDFVPNEDDSQVVWTQEERESFSAEWGRQISDAWDQADHFEQNDHKVSLRFRCEMRGTATDTQWHARVYKIAKDSDFRTSAVWRDKFPGGHDAEFDSNDDLTKPIGDKTQTAMIHEFGHMIGNPDEYKSSSPHVSDKKSIMHSGSAVRDRHLEHFVEWAKPHIEGLPKDQAMHEAPEPAMPMLKSMLSASTAAAELQSVIAWRDTLAPGRGLRFVVRRRDSQQSVPIDQVAPEDFEALEVVLLPSTATGQEEIVWQPQSADALEAIFVE